METSGTLAMRETESDDGSRILLASGVIGLATAAQLRAALLKAIASGGDAVLDVGNVTAIDLSGLQLLCSAARSWSARGACLRVRSIPQPLRDAAVAGFGRAETVFDREVSHGKDDHDSG